MLLNIKLNLSLYFLSNLSNAAIILFCVLSLNLIIISNRYTRSVSTSKADLLPCLPTTVSISQLPYSRSFSSNGRSSILLPRVLL